MRSPSPGATRGDEPNNSVATGSLFGQPTRRRREVAAAVTGYRGEILHTNVPDELVASLRQALTKPS